MNAIKTRLTIAMNERLNYDFENYELPDSGYYDAEKDFAINRINQMRSWNMIQLNTCKEVLPLIEDGSMDIDHTMDDRRLAGMWDKYQKAEHIIGFKYDEDRQQYVDKFGQLELPPNPSDKEFLAKLCSDYIKELVCANTELDYWIKIVRNA